MNTTQAYHVAWSQVSTTCQGLPLRTHTLVPECTVQDVLKRMHLYSSAHVADFLLEFSWHS